MTAAEEMRYGRTLRAEFVDRPNRFIANVILNGERVTCHVKNTGRCRELLIKGATVILQVSDNPQRKTKYDIIAVYKGGRLINIDSQVPNAVVEEGLPGIGLIPGLKTLRREVFHGDSRFDLYAEAEKECFIEVKGVTLERDGTVMFPDAPTERGVKHLKGLMRCIDEGYDAYLFLLIQTSDVDHFTPNYETHEEFGIVLEQAAEKGVHVVAYDCDVTEDSISLGKEVGIRFRE